MAILTIFSKGVVGLTTSNGNFRMKRIELSLANDLNRVLFLLKVRLISEIIRYMRPEKLKLSFVVTSHNLIYILRSTEVSAECVHSRKGVKVFARFTDKAD
jgi:hypothetical protein